MLKEIIQQQYFMKYDGLISVLCPIISRVRMGIMYQQGG